MAKLAQIGYIVLGAEMRRVCVESPFAGDRVRNDAYLLECLRDCVRRGEAPYAGHAYLTRVLDDNKPDERARGVNIHMAYLTYCNAVVVYTDYGVSGGMQQAIDYAERFACVPVEYRKLHA